MSMPEPRCPEGWGLKFPSRRRDRGCSGPGRTPGLGREPRGVSLDRPVQRASKEAVRMMEPTSGRLRAPHTHTGMDRCHRCDHFYAWSSGALTTRLSL